MNNDAPLTRSKLSSPPQPAPMTTQAIIDELAHALHDVIVESDETYLKANPEEAFVDLACRLIFHMKKITVVPAKTPRELRETEMRQIDAEATDRIFKALDEWLRARPPGVRTLETATNGAGKTEISLSEVKTINWKHPITGEHEIEVKGFFQGESVRDAYAQAAQTIIYTTHDGGEL